MRKSILSTLLAGGLTVAAGAALAGEPMKLTDAQLDGVSAGAFAGVTSISGGVGNWVNLTQVDHAAVVIGGAAFAYGNARNVSVSLVGGASSLTTQTALVTN